MPKQIQLEHDATCLYTLAQIEPILDDLAARLTQDYADKQPLLLCVMTGAVPFMGQLLTRLHFPLQIDYIHASRYAGKTTGGSLAWLAKPRIDLQDQHVILIEDIYDEGPTLMALRAFCQQAGAASVACVALANKHHDRKQGIAPEYIGVDVPDEYVFGYGMDVEGYWRNAPGIYVLNGARLPTDAES